MRILTFFSTTFKLLRVHQWYKNLLVFAALFFSLNFFNLHLLIRTLCAFFLLCFVSSANYIVNDVVDYKRDSLNPEKKNRPIASGKVSRSFALLISFLLYAFGFYYSYVLNINFFLSVLTLSLLTLSYSLFLKNYVFMDILLISTNFAIRALSGVFVISVALSVWFILVIFFFAIFLVAGKRYGDLTFLTTRQKNYKPVLKQYNQEVLDSILVISLSAIIVLYGLYSYFSTHHLMLYLYPLLLYILFKYYYLILQNKPEVRNPEKLMLSKDDLDLIVVTLIFTILTFFIYYL